MEETSKDESEKLERRREAIDRYADAIEWYMDNPEALEAKPEGMLKSYIMYLIRRVNEDLEPAAVQQASAA